MGARTAAVLAMLGPLFAGCNAKLPSLVDGHGPIDEECSPYADLLISFSPADQGSSDLGQRALGEPDDDAVDLGPYDKLIVAFLGVGGAVEEEGPDIEVVATASGDAEVSASVSADGVSFELMGTLGSDTLTVDLATASIAIAPYLQLVGVQGALSVDALRAVHTDCPRSDS